MACPDLCTAQKCQELERRIEALEASFLNHTSQSIPEAHLFSPAFEVNVDIYDNTLVVGVTIENQDRFDSVDLPVNQPNVGLNIYPVNDNNYRASPFKAEEVSADGTNKG